MKTVNITMAEYMITASLFGINAITGKSDFKATEIFEWDAAEGKSVGITIDKYRAKEDYKGIDWGYVNTQSLFKSTESGHVGVSAYQTSVYNHIIAPGSRVKTEEWFTPFNSFLSGKMEQLENNMREGFTVLNDVLRNQVMTYDAGVYFSKYDIFDSLNPKTVTTWHAELAKTFDATDASGLYTVMTTPKLEEIRFNPNAVFLQETGDGTPLEVQEGKTVSLVDTSNMKMGSRIATISAKYKQLRSKDDIDWTKLKTDGIVTEVTGKPGEYEVVAGKEHEFNIYIMTLPQVEKTTVVDFVFDPIHIDIMPQVVYDAEVFKKVVKARPDYVINLQKSQEDISSIPYFGDYLVGLPKQGTLKDYQGTKLEELINAYMRQFSPVFNKSVPDLKWTKSFYQLLKENPDAYTNKEKLNTLFKQSPEYGYLTKLYHDEILVPVVPDVFFDRDGLERSLRDAGFRTEVIDFENSNIVEPNWRTGGTNGKPIQYIGKSGDTHKIKLKLKDNPFYTANPDIVLDTDGTDIFIKTSENREFEVTIMLAEIEDVDKINRLSSKVTFNGSLSTQSYLDLVGPGMGPTFSGNYLDPSFKFDPTSANFFGDNPNGVVNYVVTEYDENNSPVAVNKTMTLGETAVYKMLKNVYSLRRAGNYSVSLDNSFIKPNSKFSAFSVSGQNSLFGFHPRFPIGDMILEHSDKVYLVDEKSTILEGSAIEISVKNPKMPSEVYFKVRLLPFTNFVSDGEGKQGFVLQYVGTRANLVKFDFTTFWNWLAGTYYLRWSSPEYAKTNSDIEALQHSQFKVDDVDVLKLPAGSGTLKEYDESYGESQPISNFHRLAITESFHAEVGSEAYFIYRPSLNKFTD